MENKDILLLMVSQELFCKVSQLEIWKIFSKLKRKERGVYKVYPIMWACELMRPPVCVTEGIINLKHVTLIVMQFACGWNQQSSFQKSFNGVQRWSDHVSTTALTLRCVCVTQVQPHYSAQKSIDCGPCWGSWEGRWRRASWKRHLTRGKLLPKFVRVEKYFTSVFQIFFLFFLRKDFLFLENKTDWLRDIFLFDVPRADAQQLHFAFKFPQMYHQRSIMGPSRLCSPSQCRGFIGLRIHSGWSTYPTLSPEISGQCKKHHSLQALAKMHFRLNTSQLHLKGTWIRLDSTAGWSRKVTVQKCQICFYMHVFALDHNPKILVWKSLSELCRLSSNWPR